MKVYSLNEAMNFFLSHANGSVICVKDGVEKECSSYPEAQEFFKS